MMKIIMFDGTVHYCSMIEFTWDGRRLILDEGKEQLDPMEIIRIVTL
jgi:hypothetical protein